jgi:ABC-2 type transport system ATP-binding protein
VRRRQQRQPGREELSVTGAAVEVDRVCRTFRRRREVFTALRDVSFTMDEGEVVGLLGVNGAGKTTLTKILSTILLPTSGTVRIFGADAVRQPRAAREVTGVVLGGERGFYGRLTGEENLMFFAMLRGIHRRELRGLTRRLLAEFGLAEAARRPTETYSRGMLQRLHLAIGLAGRPRLLLLDEPTVGLDPIEAERLRSVIAGLRDSGVTVLLTSHQLLDIERLADRVLLIDGGAVAGDMSLAQFRRLAGYAGVVTVRGTGTLPSVFDGSIDGMTVLDTCADAEQWRARLRVQSWDADLFRRLGHLLDGVAVADLEVAPVRLEDVYSQLVPSLAEVPAERRR